MSHSCLNKNLAPRRTYEYSYIMGNFSNGRTLYLWQVGNAFTKTIITQDNFYTQGKSWGLTFLLFLLSQHKVSCDWLIFANRVGKQLKSLDSWEDATQWVIQHPDNSHFRSSGRGIMFHPQAAFYHLVRWAWNLNIFKDAHSKYWWWFTTVNRVFAILIRQQKQKFQVRIVEKPVLRRSVFFTPFAKLTEGRNTWQIIQSQLLCCKIKCSSIFLCPLQRDGKREPHKNLLKVCCCCCHCCCFRS